jgi:hypothetical protein
MSVRLSDRCKDFREICKVKVCQKFVNQFHCWQNEKSAYFSARSLSVSRYLFGKPEGFRTEVAEKSNVDFL